MDVLSISFQMPSSHINVMSSYPSAADAEADRADKNVLVTGQSAQGSTAVSLNSRGLRNIEGK